MISIDEAQRIILGQTGLLGVEEVPLLNGLGRLLSEDVHAPRDVPAASNSAMDGYAFSIASLDHGRLRVKGFLPAGAPGSEAVAVGEAVRIMTGAVVPAGCDAVVPMEDVEVRGDCIRITKPVKAGSYIREQGGELRAGDLAVPAHTLLRPQEIGMLASFGQTAVQVFCRPRAAVIATGDELVEPGLPLHPGTVYNSNSFSIACQLLEAGAEPVLLGTAGDQKDIIAGMILAGMENDLLIITGGVSVGDRDFVKEVITGLGGEILFWKVDMKPGKPFAFGLLGGKPVFALPGNPVSAMVAFEMFIRPAILKQTGHRDIRRPLVKVVLTEALENSGDRPHLVSVHISLEEGVYRLAATGSRCSARLSALTASNGLLRLEPGASYAAGDMVAVMLLGIPSGPGAY